MALSAAALGSQTLVYMALDRLHHHDGIVHHRADRQHQSKKRKGVDGETQTIRCGRTCDE